jgi:ABC-type dipeptide/oligopeptide/nickel transport system ATPase component
MSVASDTTVLSVENLSIALRQERDSIGIVEGVSFAIGSGEVLALVGESGSGKSVTALSLMQLLSSGLSITSGRIMLHARDGFQGDIVALGRRQGDRVDPGPLDGNDLSGADELVLASSHHRRPDHGVVRVHDNSGTNARDRAADLLAKVGCPIRSGR